MKKLLTTVLFAIMIIVFGFSNHAITQTSSFCGEYKDFKKTLEGIRYNEQKIGAGLTYAGRATIELYSSIESGTFTVLLIHPTSDRACLIAAGKGWEIIDPGKKGTDL